MLPHLTLTGLDDPHLPGSSYPNPIGAIVFESLDATGLGRVFIGLYASIEAFEAGNAPTETREYTLGQAPPDGTPVPSYADLMARPDFSQALATLMSVLLEVIPPCDPVLEGAVVAGP